MTKNNIVFLPIEVKLREFYSKMLLSYHAIQNGYHVVIGEHSKVEKAATILPPGVFLAKGYPKKVREKILLRIKRTGHSIIELDEEGLIFSSSETYLKERINKNINSLLDHICCWGNNQKETIVMDSPALESICSITGNPRFDLLDGKYRSLFKTEVTKIRNRYKPYILVNTRFPIYNSIKGLKQPFNEEGVHIKKLYECFLAMIKELSDYYDSLEIIVRPHPSENIDSYKRFFKQARNVHVLREGNVLHWIQGAEAVIHNGCTTGLEAYLMGKFVISYRPYRSPLFDVALLDELGYEAKHANQIISMLNNRTNLNGTSQESKLLAHHYGPLKKSYSYEAILDLIKIYSPSPNLKHKLNGKDFGKDNRKKAKYLFPDLSTEEILTLFNRLNGVEGLNVEVDVNKITDRLFMLQPKK